MSDRPKFFEDLAGVAGGAISALAGLREELEAVTELAANARAGQEAAEAWIAALEARLAKLEAGAET